MKKYSFLIVLLIVTFGIDVMAQVPGFQGRKVMFGYSPSIGIRADLKEGTILTDPQFYLHHNLYSEFVVAHNVSIGLRAEASKVSYPDRHYHFEYLDPLSSTGLDWKSYNLDTNAFSSNVYSVGFDLYIYGKGYIAPLGVFHRIGLKYSMYDARSIEKQFPSGLPYDAEELMSGSAFLHYSYGRKFVVYDRYFINIAAKAGLGFNRKIWYGLVDPFDDSNDHLGFEIENMVLTSMNKAMFVSIELGIGIFADRKGFKK